jgi:hypothetical protein
MRSRLICLIRGHQLRPVYAPGCGLIYARRSDGTDGRKFTFWTARTGGRQIPAIDGHRCKRCGHTIWEDDE